MFDPDKLFFGQLDPFYHFKTASLAYYCEQPNHLLLTTQDGNSSPTPHGFLDNIESVKASAVRFARYHQAETLLTLLLGSFPHGPIISISKNPKIKLREIAAEIASRRVPRDFVIKKDGVPVEFQKWVTYKITGHLDISDVDTINEIISFVVLESDLFSQNDSFVAYKHGCLISDRSPNITFEASPGKWVDVLKLEKAVSWINCEMKSGKIIALTTGAEELNPVNDLSIIFISAMIVQAICARMLAKLNKSETYDLSLPENISVKSQVLQRFKIRIA